MSNILAIIPARSGSKSVRDKNIRILNGKPMLAYSVEHALRSKLVDRVIVSTDSPAYREIALQHGAEAPFLRPAAISGDASLDIDVFTHALRWLAEHEGYRPDMCVHLRPTHPIRDPRDIDAMLAILRADPSIDSVRSVSPARQTPYKMWLFPDAASNVMAPLASCDVPEAYNAPRQALPRAYMQNACIDVMRARTLLEKHSMTGDRIAGYPMAYDFDIDTEEEFLRAERFLTLEQALREGRRLKLCFDIDGVIASKTPGNDYSRAQPIERNIQALNALHEMGCHIVLHTARGYRTGLDWRAVTARQLEAWGVRYHELLFGKPDADAYIDDKSFGLDELRMLLSGAPGEGGAQGGAHQEVQKEENP